MSELNKAKLQLFGSLALVYLLAILGFIAEAGWAGLAAGLLPLIFAIIPALLVWRDRRSNPKRAVLALSVIIAQWMLAIICLTILWIQP